MSMINCQSAAWEIADKLINMENGPMEARLFAAQTFRQKVQLFNLFQIAYDVDQLDLQSRQSLLNSIVALLYTHRHSSKAMVTQLVLAMADLSALLLDYVDPIGLMIQTYSQDPDMISIILEFLTVLPEEVHDNRFLTNEVSC